MFYWEYPFTLPFAGAILAFFYVAQIWKHAKFDDDKKTRESSMTVE
jgi:TRAP-type C4-dicarboxylate transport system permease small subunit